MASTKKLIIGMFCGLLLLAACGTQGDGNSNLDKQLKAIITQHQLTGDPGAGRTLPEITDPLPQLGLKLFYTKTLSGADDAACVSCHHPLLGGGDNLSLSIGVKATVPNLLGPGRTHPEGPAVPRNAPTTFNTAMWDQVMFHDGRVESLGKTPGLNGADNLGIRTPDSNFGQADTDAGENLVMAQSRFPIISPQEMKGDETFKVVGHFNKTVRTHLTQKISHCAEKTCLPHNEWLPEFQKAFNSSANAEELITETNIFKAIGEYERSQNFVNTPWKSYIEGNRTAITESAKRGALLFFKPVEAGGADCARCHRGNFFTDEQFHVLAIPQIGVGTGDGPGGDDDFGRFRASGNPDDMYAFRTPTLLNVEVTGPYGHSGAYLTLDGIVRHHLNPLQALNNYDYAQLDSMVQTRNMYTNTHKSLVQLEQNRVKGLSVIKSVNLTSWQVSDIINFLLTLTDPCVKDKACLTPWMPSGEDPDGMQLQAVGVDGNPL